MRWPFSRSRSETIEPGRVAAPTRPAPAPAPVQRAAEWASLPPIQRSVSPIELTAESGLFIDHLTTQTRIEPALQPLGHDVSMDAPHGIASGIARPAAHQGGTATLQHRLKPTPAPAPAARAQRATSYSSFAPAPAPAPAPSPAPMTLARHEEHEEVATAPAEEAVAETPAEAPAAAAPAPEADAPVQRAPEAPRASAPAPAPAPAPSSSTGTSPVARHATGEAHEDEVATTPAGESPADPALVQRASEEEAPEEEGEQAATSPEDGVQRAADEPVAPTVGSRPVVPATLFRSSIGSVPPAAGLERTIAMPFAAQRAPAQAGLPAEVARAEASPMPAVPGLVQRHADGEAHAEVPAASSSAPDQAAADPVQRAVEGAAPAAPAAPGQAPGVQRSADPASPASGPASAPAVGERPLGLGAPFRAPAGKPQGGSFAPDVGPAPVFRRTRSSLASPVPDLQRAPEAPAQPPAPPAPASPSTPQSAASTPAAPSASAVGPAASASRPTAGLGAPISSGTQRAPFDVPHNPLAPAEGPVAPGAQRAPLGDVPLQFHVQRAADGGSAAPSTSAPSGADSSFAPAPAESSSGEAAAPAAPLTGLDAFIAHSAEIARMGSADAGEPGVAPQAVQRASEAGPVDAAVLMPPDRPLQLAPRLDLPFRRRETASHSGGDRATVGGAQAATAAAPAVQRAPQTAAAPRLHVLPLASQRPLQVQRSSDEVPAPVRSHVEKQVSASLEGVKVHRSPESGSAARQLKARAFTTGGEIHLPSEHGPLDREPGRSLVAHELVHVAQQRQLGASLPTEDSHHGQELESQAQRVEVATQQSDAPLVLARKPDAESIAQNAAQLAVQRVTAETPRVPIVQTASAQYVARAEAAGGSSSSATPATPAAAGGGAAGAGGGGGSEGPDPLTGIPTNASHAEGPALQENQLRQAWTYVRSRIGEELTEDRERAGRITDLF